MWSGVSEAEDDDGRCAGPGHRWGVAGPRAPPKETLRARFFSMLVVALRREGTLRVLLMMADAPPLTSVATKEDLDLRIERGRGEEGP